MQSPRKPKELQNLAELVITLSRFVSQATNKCLPFFDTLKGGKKFEWMEKCELTFQQLKEDLGKPSLLSKPVSKERLFLYLVVLENIASSILV